jgi:hypothetical protein
MQRDELEFVVGVVRRDGDVEGDERGKVERACAADWLPPTETTKGGAIEMKEIVRRTTASGGERRESGDEQSRADPSSDDERS